MRKSNYEFEILVNGHPAKEYYKDGKIYIEGRKGQTFSLKIRNHGYNRILAIPSVDGLSVMDGKPASLKSRGYVISSRNTDTIHGWRTSDKDVAEFYFTDPSDSYADRIGKGKNVGVIGLAVYREKDWFPSITYFNDTLYRGGSSSTTGSLYSLNSNSERYEASCSAKSLNKVSQNLGTGFGKSKKSEVITTSFDRESYPDVVFEIYYNTKAELKKLGIDFKEAQYVSESSAFPGSGHYCQPPR